MVSNYYNTAASKTVKICSGRLGVVSHKGLNKSGIIVISVLV